MIPGWLGSLNRVHGGTINPQRPDALNYFRFRGIADMA
jgi:hypothetical protein